MVTCICPWPSMEAFNILDLTHVSEYRADVNPSLAGGKKHDNCMHWCLPGVTDTWNAHLSNIKVQNGAERVPFWIVKAGKYKSTPYAIPDPIGVTVYKALHGSALILLDITHVSEFRAYAHPSTAGGEKHDCMHWSLPGVTDTWNGFFSSSKQH
ncbi:hypothetical protein C3L33_21053, partial [Rhododendron williamsianum]